MKRKISIVLAALAMTSGVGFMSATQVSARECQYNTPSCNWEATKELCLANIDTINARYRHLKTNEFPQPFRSRFNSCSKYAWKFKG
ncbi:hypothetical protein ACFYYM_34165 [Streptomyces erythrochromogenes]|uniref:hypothetical protein n=1 Tax=Streptomyces erythrochromogenes TaxID=285574 RepID=UPI0036CC5BC2